MKYLVKEKYKLEINTIQWDKIKSKMIKCMIRCFYQPLAIEFMT